MRSRSTGSPVSGARREPPRRDGPRIERIVLLRALAVLVALAFLVLIVRVAFLAFGPPDRAAMRIDGAIERSLGAPPAPSR